MRHESAMRQARLVPGKHGITALMLAQKESEIKAEAILVHMHQEHTATKQLKDTVETPTLMVHAVNINETTTLPLPTEEEWIQDTS